MSPQTGKDTPIELLSTDSYAQYLLRGPKDLAYVLRAGCLLIDLPANAENQIERFILKAERERNHYCG